MKVHEIVNHSAGGDWLDNTIDHELAALVYKLYKQVLYASNNYQLTSYEIKSRHQFENDFNQIKDIIVRRFPPKSTARRMINELVWYFN